MLSHIIIDSEWLTWVVWEVFGVTLFWLGGSFSLLIVCCGGFEVFLVSDGMVGCCGVGRFFGVNLYFLADFGHFLTFLKVV